MQARNSADSEFEDPHTTERRGYVTHIGCK